MVIKTRSNIGKILITGASGRVAKAFIQAAGNQFYLRLTNRSEISDSISSHNDIMPCDVTDLADCRRACRGIDTVLHLAASPSRASDNANTLINNNIKGTSNIFQAALEARCKRVIFASSAQVIEGYPLDYEVRPQDAPRPKNLYGVSKALGEDIATYFAYQKGLSVITVRFANLTHLDDQYRSNARDLSTFLSYEDAVDLLIRCIRVADIDYAVVHGISNNHYKRLSLTETTKLIGYYPKDDAFKLVGFN